MIGASGVYDTLISFAQLIFSTDNPESVVFISSTAGVWGFGSAAVVQAKLIHNFFFEIVQNSGIS